MGASHRSGAVLVVEDDFLIAMDSKAVLAELGFHDVYIAHNLANGRALLSSRHLDLSLLDINIGPDLVFPLATEMSVRHIPIIFLTGRAQSDVPPEWSSHPILSKPLTKNTLLLVELRILGPKVRIQFERRPVLVGIELEAEEILHVSGQRLLRVGRRLDHLEHARLYTSRYFLREFNAGFTLPRSFASEPATS